MDLKYPKRLKHNTCSSLGVEMARTMYSTVIKDLVMTRLNDVIYL